MVEQIPPQFLVQKALTSLFDPARAGKAVVRPNDLLALRMDSELGARPATTTEA